VQGAAKLRHAITAQRALMVDAKYPVLVAEKSDRLAPGLQVRASRIEIGKGRLTFDKLEVHQAAGRIVNEHEQRGLRTTILEPPVLAAVNLN